MAAGYLRVVPSRPPGPGRVGIAEASAPTRTPASIPTMPDTTDRPRLSGFTIVKNASVHDYPVEASLRSALRFCDEVVVNVGQSRDDTLERVRALDDPRMRILHRVWPEPRGSRLRELADETNIALDACRHDWALYLQADEVLHEDDEPALLSAVERADADPRVEGLLFDFLHFEGSPDWELRGRRRHRREVRVVRQAADVRSVRDALSFRVGGAGGRVPRVLRSGARIFHYNYVKSREGLDAKRRLWVRSEGGDPDEADPHTFYRYRGLRRFEGDHPEVMEEWLAGRDWPFDPESASRPPWNLKTLKVLLSDAVERRTGRRIWENRNWELVGDDGA